MLLARMDSGQRPNSPYRLMSMMGPEQSVGLTEVYALAANDLDQPVLAIRALTTEWIEGVDGALVQAFALTEEVARLFFLHADLSRAL